MALFIHPFHIATRGRFDGEYGIATRGYVVCPDLVSRFPAFGEVDAARLFANVTQEELEAWLADAGLTAELQAIGDQDAILGLSRVLTASVSDEGFGLTARVDMALDGLVATVTCPDESSAALAADGMLGDVSQGGGEAIVSDADGPTAVVEERPGEGSCRRSGEPC